MKLDSKIFGYSAAGLGILGLLISNQNILKSIPLLNLISPKYIVIGSIILVGVGVVLIMSLSSNKSQIGKEVPIYKGKEIIGYRMVGK